MRLTVFRRALLLLIGPGPLTALAQGDTPSPEDFLRIAGGRVSVIRDRIYYNGGEMAQPLYPEGRHSDPMNSTLSIDLSKAWAPENVEITALPNPSDRAVMFNQAIITDEASDAFYIWGGVPAWFATPPDPILWKFTVDSDEDGGWGTEQPANNALFAGLGVRVYASYVSTPTAGFIIGGESSHRNSADDSWGDMNGLISYNYTTKEWAEHSEAPYSDNGTVWGGAAVYAPNFGPNGLVFVLGGLGERDENAYAISWVDFKTLHFFDPVTKSWHRQEATGDIPESRVLHCAVGVEGANGTYDIFVYGGAGDTSTYADVSVLSLPAFEWKRIDGGIKGRGRAMHHCALVGKRQMLSWGGLNISPQVTRIQSDGTGGEYRWNVQDNFPQGIGIFDMSAGTWKNDYSPDMDAYRAHPDVASFYEEGKLEKVQWSSDDVRALFVENEPPETDRDGESTREEEAGSESPPVGAIAGGVVGGVALVAAIAAVWFFCFRKHRRRKPSGHQHAELANHAWQTPTAYAPVSQGYPAPGAYNMNELQGYQVPAEKDGGRYHSSTTPVEVHGDSYSANAYR